ncbi:50S ribosome-binding GTPase [Candidatus Micrarchaeota archaeon]|jgi:hypothetical protein|nr:50S ribosome-binding GTPase [Candidatus Micrarchaeota archaeon]
MDGKMARKTMRNPFGRIKWIIKESDAIIEVVDARDIEGTRNQAIEKLARGKRLIIAINKSDLTNERPILKTRLDYVYVSSKKKQGKKKLLDLIVQNTKKDHLKVGILGYPDVGKSSLINYLVGRKAVKTGATPGVTKGKQYIRISERILLIDSPGVYPRKEGRISLVMKSAVDIDKFEDPEEVALRVISLFIKKNPNRLFEYFDIKPSNNPNKILNSIAERRKLILKAGELNIYEAAKILIRDYQKGKLKL